MAVPKCTQELGNKKLKPLLVLIIIRIHLQSLFVQTLLHIHLISSSLIFPLLQLLPVVVSHPAHTHKYSHTLTHTLTTALTALFQMSFPNLTTTTFLISLNQSVCLQQIRFCPLPQVIPAAVKAISNLYCSSSLYSEINTNEYQS